MTITTSVLDSFNAGATQLLTARAGWSSVATFNSGNISLQTDAAPTYAGSANTPTTEHSNLWATQFPAEQEAWFTYGPLGVDNVQILARCDRLNAGGVLQSYEFQVTWNGVNTRLSRQLTVLASVTLPAPVSGDSFALQCIGTRLTGWKRASGGQWLPVVTTSDAAYQAAGYTGLTMFASGPTSVTEFGAGAAIAENATNIDYSRFPRFSMAGRSPVA